MRILSIGEILWDVFDEGELLGGAPLNFSANSSRLGNDVRLLTAVGADDRGARALETVRGLELTTDFIQTSKLDKTGTAIVVTDSLGNASYSIYRPAAFDDLQVDDPLLTRLESEAPDWIYFGTLFATFKNSERFVIGVIQKIDKARCFTI